LEIGTKKELMLQSKRDFLGFASRLSPIPVGLHTDDGPSVKNLQALLFAKVQIGSIVLENLAKNSS